MKQNGLGNDDSYESEFDDDYWDDAADDESNRARAQGRGYRPAYGEPSRRRSAQREGAFNMMLWLLEGATGVVEELRHNDLGLSEDFWVHAQAARREGLLAMRAVLDQLIDDGDETPHEDSERQQRRKRRGGINVDF
jgi:hypothetical protein